MMTRRGWKEGRALTRLNLDLWQPPFSTLCERGGRERERKRGILLSPLPLFFSFPGFPNSHPPVSTPYIRLTYVEKTNDRCPTRGRIVAKNRNLLNVEADLSRSRSCPYYTRLKTVKFGYCAGRKRKGENCDGASEKYINPLPRWNFRFNVSFSCISFVKILFSYI